MSEGESNPTWPSVSTADYTTNVAVRQGRVAALLTRDQCLLETPFCLHLTEYRGLLATWPMGAQVTVNPLLPVPAYARGYYLKFYMHAYIENALATGQWRWCNHATTPTAYGTAITVTNTAYGAPSGPTTMPAPNADVMYLGLQVITSNVAYGHRIKNDWDLLAWWSQLP